MPSRARIYRKPKSAMQSGTATTHVWVLEFEATEPRRADPLMGWSGGTDTQSQVHVNFDTREEAIAYADKHELAYDVELPHDRKFRPRSYSENFRYGRTDNWTH